MMFGVKILAYVFLFILSESSLARWAPVLGFAALVLGVCGGAAPGFGAERSPK